MLVVVATVLLLVTETHSTICQRGKIILTGANGQLSSPDPGKSGICSWEVKIPEDSRIVFYFNFYEIEHCGNSYSNENRCAGCTRIELRNSSNKPPWYTFCDFKASIPEPLSTDTSTLLVNFQLEADDKESRFTAEYESWPSHDRVDLVTTSTAHISSPLFPGRYPRNSHFRWSVVSPSGYRVKIEFSKFDLRYCARCQECDFLRVHDGASPESQVLGTYCSNPGTLYTSGNNVWIEFVASKDLNQVHDSIGFKATLSREIRLYVIVVPCILGIFLVSLVVAILVVMCRRRRLSPSGNGAPVVQMSLLNEDDNFSNAHLSDAGPHIEASLPVYRPTTQKIRRWRTALHQPEKERFTLLCNMFSCGHYIVVVQFCLS